MADIKLQEESFKRAEKARLRNKVEDRKLSHVLNRKHGLHETHEYRIQVMSEERRLIEKELEKIRTGIRKPPPYNPFDLQSLEEQTPRGGVKQQEEPDRVRGRAMSIHDQSQKYMSPSHPPDVGTRPSQAPPNQEDVRRPSQAPPYQGNVRRSSQTLPNQGNARRPSQAPSYQGNVRRSSQAPPYQGDVRRSSQAPPYQGDVRRPSQAPPYQGDVRRPSQAPPHPGDVRRSSMQATSQQAAARGTRRQSHVTRSQAPAASRRQSQLVTSQPGETEQPSVNDLLKMAMKNAVMYAVKHVDKLHIHSDNEDDDDSDDDDSDEDYETTSQYRRGVIVVTKEGDSSSDDDDDVNMDSRSTKTITTRRSEKSRRSIYGDFEEEGSDSKSPFHQRPVSRTSTTLTSISQVSGATTNKRKSRDLASTTPRNANYLSLPRENSSSFGQTPRRTNNLTPSSFSNTPRGKNRVTILRESTTSDFVDSHSLASGTSAGSRSTRRNTVQADAANGTKKSTSFYPKSGSSRHSDVTQFSLTPRRPTSDVTLLNDNNNNNSNKTLRNNYVAQAALSIKSARSNRSLGEDQDLHSTRTSVSRTQRTNLRTEPEKGSTGEGYLSGAESHDARGQKGKKRRSVAGVGENSKTSPGRALRAANHSQDDTHFLPHISS